MTQSPTIELELHHPNQLIGIDEAGCGPWAGPVVASAVHIYEPQSVLYTLLGINDSKKLSLKKRELFFEEINRLHDKQKLAFGIGQASVQEIDAINIGQATRLAMVRACNELMNNLKSATNSYIAYVDGIRLPSLHIQTHGLVKGDQKCISIAIASVIAKVTRDHIMAQLDREYPHYGWGKNAGYGTALHQQALNDYGITPHHRQSYAPIQKLLISAA